MRKYLFITMIPLLITSTGCVRRNLTKSTDVVEEKYVHKYGLDVPEQEWQARGKEGQVIKTLKNGVTVVENYSRGKKCGECTYSYPRTFIVERSLVYDNDELIAEREHSQQGAPLREVRHLEDGCLKLTTWYEDGSPKSVEIVEDDHIVSGHYFMQGNQVDSTVEDGEGIRNVRDEFGELLSTDVIKGGTLVKSTSYYKNGAPHEIVFYEGGDKRLVKRYFASGEPDCIEEWRGDYLSGTTIVFRGEKKVAEVPFVNGVKNGVEKRYTHQGELAEEISWKQNRKHGPSVVYYGKNKGETEWFYEGMPTTKVNFDLMNTFKPKRRS